MNDIGCHEEGCNNKFYKMDRINSIIEVPCCLKHYRMYALGYSEYEASRGKRERYAEIHVFGKEVLDTFKEVCFK